MKKLWVISLGGSRIVPDDVDYGFLKNFKSLIDRHKDKKFVVVCGGGRTARRYILALKKLRENTKEESMQGIAITRLNARFMTRFFGKDANTQLPKSMKAVKNLLEKNRVVFCGALRWQNNNTSDGTSAKIAGFLGCDFINLTDVKGLYSDDPHKSKKSKFISRINWKDFLVIAKKIHYKAGQHFVLDLVAAEEILKMKITTYLVGSLKSVDNILKNKDFIGTVIRG